MRRCENCHDAATSHQAWLPYVETHMAAMACETCHIPKLPRAGDPESGLDLDPD